MRRLPPLAVLAAMLATQPAATKQYWVKTRIVGVSAVP